MDTSIKNLFSPRYTLAVRNLATSTSFYIDMLGFELLNEYPGWSFLGRDNVIIMLGECTDERPASEIGDHSYFAYIEVRDASMLFQEFETKGVHFIKRIQDEIWGMREFGIQTVDGHRIMFGQDLA